MSIHEQDSIHVTAASMLSSLGCSLAELRTSVARGEPCLSYHHRFASAIAAPLGEIPWSRIGIADASTREADDLLWQGSQFVLREHKDLIPRVGADRIGLFVGTTTTGISGFFETNRQRKLSGQSVQSHLNAGMQQAYLAHRLADEFGIRGPVYTFSTSCVASSQAFVMAHDAIRIGWIDAALVLGVDVLNLTTLHGFNALQLLDADYCQPFTEERKGINLSEAVALLVLEKGSAEQKSLLKVKSYAALSEAHHMTQPSPGGLWMKACMEQALEKAGLSPSDIAAINPHGTGTLANDEAEMAAITAIFGDTKKAFASKAFSGHALGASGALEIPLCALALQSNGGRYALKNSFGFGGANLSLVFERGDL